MKNSKLLLAVLALLLLIAFLFVWPSVEVPEQQSTATPSGIGTPEQADARAAFDFLRQRNPITNELPTNMRQRALDFATQLPKSHARGLNFSTRGPANVGGRTRGMAIDVRDEQHIIAGQVTGGIWKTVNGGQLFEKQTLAHQLHSVTSIKQDTRAGHQDTWYAGTGEYYGVISGASFSALGSGNGIFKSIDNGVTWELLQSTVSNSPTTHANNGDFDFVWELAVDASNSSEDELYAAVFNGIYRTLDGGQSWTSVLGLDTTTNSTSIYSDIVITSDGVCYAAISTGSPSAGIWRSVDGVNWVEITPNDFPSNSARIELAIAPSNEDVVYAIANANNASAVDHVLYRYDYISGDGSGAGGQWDNRSDNLPNGSCTGFYDFDFGPFNSQSSYDLCIAVKPNDENVVFIGGTNIYRSNDGFTTNSGEWIAGYQCDPITPSNYIWPNQHPDQHLMLFSKSDPNIMYSANDGGVYKTNNCMASPTSIEWESLNKGYTTGQFYTVAIEPGETYSDMLVGGLQDNGTFMTVSNDPAVDWKSVFYGDGSYCAITPGRKNYYLSWQTGKVFKFEIDDQANVLGMERIDPAGGNGHAFIAPFILDPSNHNRMFFAAGSVIWRNDSLDIIPVTGNEYNPGTVGWTRINQAVPGGGRVSALDVSAADSSTLYMASEGGQIRKVINQYDPNNIERVDINISLNSSGYVSCVDACDIDANEVIVSYSNYGIPSIYHTLDGGDSWTDVSGNLEENPDGSGDGPAVFWVHKYRYEQNAPIYFAGTSVGLYSTSELNGVATIWTQESPDVIGNMIINMIQSRPFDGNIVVATHGNGIYGYRQKMDPTSINSGTIQSQGISKVFPNPASQSTTIMLQDEDLNQLQIEVWDALGRKVHQIAPIGQKIVWDLSGPSGQKLSKGNYWIVLRKEGQLIDTKALMIQ